MDAAIAVAADARQNRKENLIRAFLSIQKKDKWI
jgi:hypothetical protein